MSDKMVKITDTQQAFNKKLIQAFFDEANARINRRKETALVQFKALTLNFLTSAPTYQSLVSGELAAHFGFRKGQEESRLQPILNTFINSIDYKFKPFSATGGTFEFFGIPKHYQDALSLPEAEIKGENRKKFSTPYPLPWLNWLLLQGDTILVPDHKIKLGVISSRSGQAIMVEGGSWAVPREFAGTANDNWVTKISDGVDESLGSYQAQVKEIMEGML